MARNQSTLLEYSGDKFVDRESEIELVLDKARKLADGHSVDQRTVIFSGERGTGKTWLLAHLRAELGEAWFDGEVFLIDLRRYADWDPILAVGDILKRLSTEVGEPREGLGVTPADMSRNLMRQIRACLEGRPLVVLVDQVYESEWELLRALENYLLGPLTRESRVLIVMAGRGRTYPWKTPDLRLKAEFVDLEPFDDQATTEEQLKRQQREAASRAAEIHRISGGNPLVNRLLAVHDPSTALDRVISGMLEPVPAERRDRVREYLEALCVLRSFDEDRIPRMLAAYYDDESLVDWSYVKARRVREKLVKWAFARWDADKGGYVLEDLTRKLLEQYLEAAKPDVWKRLQQAASELYEEWAQDYERTKDRWKQERDYHILQLQDPGQPTMAASF